MSALSGSVGRRGEIAAIRPTRFENESDKSNNRYSQPQIQLARKLPCSRSIQEPVE